MFHKEPWFAWFPVTAMTRRGPRWAWLEMVMRERAQTEKHSGNWRYYTTN